MNIIVVLFKL